MRYDSKLRSSTSKVVRISRNSPVPHVEGNLSKVIPLCFQTPFSDGGLAFRPFAVIEVGHVPILHPGWQRDVTESPVLIFFKLVLLFGGINRREAPDPFLWQRLANRLPVILPFPLPLSKVPSFLNVCAVPTISLYSSCSGLSGGNGMIPRRVRFAQRRHCP